MNWKLISKDPVKQPKTGIYSDWKEQIAEECYHQCVYCSIHEKPWGGIDHYHIDHFRPKSKTEFKYLENDICNLFYACPICNRFKKDDWPGDPTNLDDICYPDPSKTDYNTLFELNQQSFTLSGNYISANYIIERLYLNRPQLIFERREHVLLRKESMLTKEIASMMTDGIGNEVLRKVIIKMTEIRQHLQLRETIRPYKLSEIRKVEK